MVNRNLSIHIIVNVFLFTILSSTVIAGSTVILPQLTNPAAICAENDRIYITQGAEIFIYSRPGFEYVKKFGRAGEGPSEFMLIHPKQSVKLRIEDDHLLVNSLNRLSFFSKSGQFIKEIKTKGIASLYMPLKNKYAALAPKTEAGAIFYTINLYDEKLNKIREIKRVKAPLTNRNTYRLFNNSLRAVSVKNRLFILSSNEFSLDVMNAQAKLLFTIKRDYKKVNIDKAFKKNFEERMKKNPASKAFYERIKNNIIYPEHFPAISNIYTSVEFIYIATYKRQDDNFEFFVYNVDGKFIERLFIHLKMKDQLAVYPAAIHNNNVFQVI